MKKRFFSLLLCFIIIACIIPLKANAYQYNGYVLSNPSNVKYTIGVLAMMYNSNINTCVPTWSSYCSEIGVSSVGVGSENVYFHSEYTVDNGTYAVCYHTSNDYHSITFYASFSGASTIIKNETIVHEFGHVLGLAHCETSKNSISVMRETGFNGKAYPLSDDIAGITNLY